MADIGHLSTIYAIFLNESRAAPESEFLAEARDLALWQLTVAWREHVGLPPLDRAL